MLTKPQLQFIISIYQKRLRAVKLLLFLTTPFGIFFSYALIMVISEGFEDATDPVENFGLYFGVVLLFTGIAATIYLWISFFKLKRDLKTLPAFEIETVVGTPKFKEAFYSFPIFGAYGLRLGGRIRRVRLIGELNGIKYNFFAYQKSDIEQKQLKFTAITRKSFWLGCNWKKFVVEIYNTHFKG